MKQEEKDLLFNDLCSRLPYKKLKVRGVFFNYNEEFDRCQYEECDREFKCEHLGRYSTLKPYLLPISSLSYEQKEKYCQLRKKIIYNNKGDVKGIVNKDVTEYINWCYENNLDVNNLIPMGLAIDATRLNIY